MTRRRAITSISYEYIAREILKLPEGMRIIRAYEQDNYGADVLSVLIEDDANHRLPAVAEGEQCMQFPIIFHTDEDGTVENITWQDHERRYNESQQEFEL